MLNSNGTGYHPITRWLHAGLVMGVIVQLLLAIFMAHPDHHTEEDSKQALNHLSDALEVTELKHKDGNLEQFLMQTHRTGGLAVALIVLANLIWAISLRGSPRKRQLSVLFSLQHWREALLIAKGIPLIILNNKALPKPGNALSLVFEMLGLLIMTVMAITGSIIWNLWGGPGSAVPNQAEILMGIHSSAAILLFIYLTGHISMSLMHAKAGDPVFARILPLKMKSRLSQRSAKKSV